MLMFIKNIKDEFESIENFMVEKSIDMHQILTFKCFNQLWPSTSLGFDGWGGSSMTYALTTVIEELYSIDGRMSSRFHVFFGGRYAIRSIAGKRDKVNVNALVKGAKKRKEIYRNLLLFEVKK